MLTIPVDLRQKLISQLISDESYRQFMYVDSRGVPTIGIGRNLSKVGLSLDEALYLLNDDIMASERDLAHYAADWYGSLDDVRKVGILNMTFQLGIEGVLKFKDMIAHIKSKEWDEAAKAMLDSTWATETPARCHRAALIISMGSL